MIEVIESALQKAAGEGMDEFIQVFTDKYKEVIGGELTADTMPLLTGEQHSLLAYQIFRDELMVGGFCQLIQNGYGGYIFDNPFAKVMRLWGADEFSKLIYKAKKIFDANRKDLEKERTDDIIVGGFCQLIQNGYGGYIFDNPFAKVMRLWGADEFSKLIYKAKKIFDANRKDLEKERTDDEFMAMYEQYEAFDELEEVYLEMEEQVTALIASYVDEHLELFAKIIK